MTEHPRDPIPAGPPGQNIARQNDVGEALAAICSVMLPTGWAAPTEPYDTAMWVLLLEAAGQHGVLGPVAWAADTGWLPVTDEQWHDLEVLHEARLLLQLQLDRTLLDVDRLLEAGGVPHRVLKGSAVAHLDYPDPAWRFSSDIDMAVPGEHVEAAVTALSGGGGCRAMGERRPGFDAKFAKDVKVFMPGHVPVELHRTFVIGGLGQRLSLVEMFERPDHFEIGGRRLAGLDREGRLLHACYSAVVGDLLGAGHSEPRLRYERDIAQLLLGPDLDHGLIVDRARRWRSQTLVSRAIRGAVHRLRLTGDVPLLRWANEVRPPLRDRFMLEAYLRPGGNTLAELVAVVQQPDLRSGYEYALAMARPSAGYLAAVERDSTGHLRVALRRITGRS